MSNIVLSGIMGLVVADALGVPVEFQSRDSLREDPVIGVRAYGTYNQPAGTWSDDSSMTLALLDSLSNGLDYKDIMDKFLAWYEQGSYTPHGQVFDIGLATKAALNRYKAGEEPLKSGGIEEYDNGNGSLMRILPILFYLQERFGMEFINNEKSMGIIHNISGLTHRHKRSQIACGIYISIASNLFRGMGLNTAVKSGIYNAMKYYKSHDQYTDELDNFQRIQEENFKDLSEDQIQSGGYVVHSLEASIWCLLNTDSYETCVLKAINLGKDTDTTAAIAGGLAGLRYGYDSIPEEWLEPIARRDYIVNLCKEYYYNSLKKSGEKLLHYIDYFEKANPDDACSWTKNGRNEFDNFRDAYYKSNLVDYNYLTTIKNYLGDGSEVDRHIDDADLTLLKAILTGYIRGERFNEGLWVEAIEKKIFLRILYRLKKIDK